MSTNNSNLRMRKPTPNGYNHTKGVNGNDYSAKPGTASSMSEDEEMPLVCTRAFTCKRTLIGTRHLPQLIVQSQTLRSSDVLSTPPPRSLKRKKPVYAESSSDDDTPLASSPIKRLPAAIVPMPGAAEATTVSSTTPNGKNRRIFV